MTRGFPSLNCGCRLALNSGVGARAPRDETNAWIEFVRELEGADSVCDGVRSRLETYGLVSAIKGPVSRCSQPLLQVDDGVIRAYGRGLMKCDYTAATAA